jgi:hypothetical protein
LLLGPDLTKTAKQLREDQKLSLTRNTTKPRFTNRERQWHNNSQNTRKGNSNGNYRDNGNNSNWGYYYDRNSGGWQQKSGGGGNGGNNNSRKGGKQQKPFLGQRQASNHQHFGKDKRQNNRRR